MPTKIALFLSLALIAAQPAMAASPQAAAQFVQRHGIGNNLKPMAMAVAQNTQTFAMIVSKSGASQAQAMVSSELDRCAAKYQSQWNANLAQVYAQHFTDEELASLTAEGRNSRFSSKLAANMNTIGAEVQRLSQPVLTAYVTEALGTAFERVSPKQAN